MKVTCPICAKPATEATTPFCCVRCRDVDLNRWLTGGYAIKTNEKPENPVAEDDES